MSAMNYAQLPALPPHADGVNLTLAELLNYQQQAIRWLPPSKSIWSQISGLHASQQKGRGIDFSEVRPYQAGDDIRAIDWRVTARTGKTHTKLFSEEREQPVMLLVDISSSMAFGSELLLKSIQAAHFASLLSWITVKQQDRIGAVIYNGLTQKKQALRELKPTSRKQGPLAIIHALIESHKERLLTPSAIDSSIGWQEALAHLHRLCPKGSDIVIISDFYALKTQDKKRLSQLRQHNRVQFMHIFDPLEQGQTAFRGQELVSDQNQTRWLNFSSAKTRETLAQDHAAHYRFVADMAKSLAIPLHQLSAAQALIPQLQNR